MNLNSLHIPLKILSSNPNENNCSLNILFYMILLLESRRQDFPLTSTGFFNYIKIDEYGCFNYYSNKKRRVILFIKHKKFRRHEFGILFFIWKYLIKSAISVQRFYTLWKTNWRKNSILSWSRVQERWTKIFIIYMKQIIKIYYTNITENENQHNTKLYN